VARGHAGSARACHLPDVGARFFAQIIDRPRLEAFEKDEKENLPPFGARAYASFTTDTPTLVDDMLDSVVADVPNYMGSIVEGKGCSRLGAFTRSWRVRETMAATALPAQPAGRVSR
jgi:hypothetical protein